MNVAIEGTLENISCWSSNFHCMQAAC